MKPNKKQLLVYLAIVAVACCATLYIIKDYARANRELRQKVEQLQSTLSHSTVEIVRDTIRDSIPVASQPAVVIDKTDYKKMEADAQLIKDLKLKCAQVESEMRVLLANQGQVTLQASADSDSVLRYKDKWCEFEYQMKPRELTYNVRDSLVTVVSRVYKHKFLWFRWGTKGYQVQHVNFNPHSRFEYGRFIKVER